MHDEHAGGGARGSDGVRHRDSRGAGGREAPGAADEQRGLLHRGRGGPDRRRDGPQRQRTGLRERLQHTALLLI